MSAVAARNMVGGFLDVYGFKSADLSRAIGSTDISRQTVENIVAGRHKPRGGTVALLLRGVRKLKPRPKLSNAGFRFLLDTKDPKEPEKRLELITEALAMRDEEPAAERRSAS